MLKIMLLVGDITTSAADVVVNAANKSLAGGGGVDGAIHRAAGPELHRACRDVGGCPVGEVRVTSAFRMPASLIFHTVGPVWRGGNSNEAALLGQCYQSCFREAEKQGIRSIAFPAISCGVYGYPHKQACDIAVRETLRFREQQCQTLTEVLFYAFSEDMLKQMQQSCSAQGLEWETSVG